MLSSEEFGRKLKELRCEKGLSQQQLADRIVISRSAIANYEAGNRLPDVSMLARISDSLGIESYILLNYLRETEEVVNIIVVEDIEIVLSGCVKMLGEELPEACVYGFETASSALDFAHVNRIAAAFLDIELGMEDGLSLARALTDIDSSTNIIFLTSHAEYMEEALHDHCSGYIMKPMTPEKIHHEIRNLRFPVRGLNK